MGPAEHRAASTSPAGYVSYVHRLQGEPTSGLEQIFRHIQLLVADFCPGVKEARRRLGDQPGTPLVLWCCGLSLSGPGKAAQGILPVPLRLRLVMRWLSGPIAGQMGGVVGTLPPPLLWAPAAL